MEETDWTELKGSNHQERSKAYIKTQQIFRVLSEWKNFEDFWNDLQSTEKFEIKERIWHIIEGKDDSATA